MSREELLEARANVEHQLRESDYGSIIGGSFGASPKPPLRKRLQEILAEIDQELAELDVPKS
ncbi:MAG TPA: hypothetical protein VHY79_01555 [Rhizomicrobium sp.]|jgi:hypothetical protein|nr:hypothetical protein [Rhizomicrobium sp.]